MDKLTQEERETLVRTSAHVGLAMKVLQLVDDLESHHQKLHTMIEMCAANFDAMCEQRDIADTERDRADWAEVRIERVVNFLTKCVVVREDLPVIKAAMKILHSKDSSALHCTDEELRSLYG